MYGRYKFKFYLNASHAIYLDGVLGEIHPHTWEITLDTVKGRNDFVQFDTIEKEIERFLGRFQDGVINEIKPFDVTNPTLENLTVYFKRELMLILSDNGWLLTRIEVAETPARSYIIEIDEELDEVAAPHDKSGGDVEAAAEKKLALIFR